MPATVVLRLVGISEAVARSPRPSRSLDEPHAQRVTRQDGAGESGPVVGRRSDAMNAEGGETDGGKERASWTNRRGGLGDARRVIDSANAFGAVDMSQPVKVPPGSQRPVEPVLWPTIAIAVNWGSAIRMGFGPCELRKSERRARPAET